MKWYNSIKIKLFGFFFTASVVFMITMLIVINILKENALFDNASKEVSLETIQILSNLQHAKDRFEEIVLTLASVSKELKNVPEKKKIIYNLLKVNNSGLVTSGGIWFEPYAVDNNRTEYSYFFNRIEKNQFHLVENYLQKSPIHYRSTEFYSVAKHLNEGETYWTKVYTDPVTKIRMITVVAPIYDHDKFLGVASLDVKIKDHSEKMFNTFNFTERYLMMTDREGTIMVKSALLETFLNQHQLDHQNNNNFSKEFNAIHDISEKSILSRDFNRTIAKVLSEGSPEIGVQDSKHIAIILQKQKENLEKGIIKNIRFIENDPILQKESVIVTFYFPSTHWRVIIGIPKEQVLNASNVTYQKIINAIIFLTLFVTLMGYFMLKQLFVNPIEKLNDQLQNNNDNDHYKLLQYDGKGEIGILVDNLNIRTVDLASSKEREADEIHKRIVNEKLLIQQAKMAEMGSMMDSVAHQWKQPLNALSMYSEIIKSDFEDGEVNEAYIDQFRDNIQLQIDHMVTTLDEFRTFFRPNKEEEVFQLLDVINSVLFLTKDEFMKHAITIKILQKSSIEIHGYRNEFKHLILNIINNAKDAFDENNIKERVISFSLIKDHEGERLEIRDNAGGVPENVIDNIFKANFTTKEDKGTGIGLFMSTQIAKKSGADLSVINEKDGACFIVRFNLNHAVAL